MHVSVHRRCTSCRMNEALDRVLSTAGQTMIGAATAKLKKRFNAWWVDHCDRHDSMAS